MSDESIISNRIDEIDVCCRNTFVIALLPKNAYAFRKRVKLKTSRTITARLLMDLPPECGQNSGIGSNIHYR